LGWVEETLVGWEIETNIEAEDDPCEHCDETPCVDCDLCFVCDELVRMHERDGYKVERNCNEGACELVIHGHRPERIAPRRRVAFCDECRRHYIYEDLWQMMCDECTRVYEDPYHVAESRYGVDVSKFERIYVDRSCGLELSTKPYRLLEFPYVIYPEWVKVKDEISVRDRCGCHVNLSNPVANSKRYADDVVMTSIYFSDMLAWFFLTKDTNGREGTKYRNMKAFVYYDFLKNDYSTEKYSFLNVKQYCDCYVYEYRWVDGAEFFNATYVASVLCAMLISKPVIKWRNLSVEDFRTFISKVSERYSDMCRGIFKNEYEDVATRKLEEFMVLYKNEIKEFSRKSRIDLEKVLLELMKLPVHKRDKDVDLGVSFERKNEEVMRACVG